MLKRMDRHAEQMAVKGMRLSMHVDYVTQTFEGTDVKRRSPGKGQRFKERVHGRAA